MKEIKYEAAFAELQSIVTKMENDELDIDQLSEQLKALDPQLLLKRGYSITRKDGHAVRDPKTLRKGDEIETVMEKGTIKSIIK